MKTDLAFITEKLRTFVVRHIRIFGGLSICALLGVVVALMNSNSVHLQTSRGDGWFLPSDKTLLLVSDVDTILEKPLFGGPPVIKTIPEVVEDGTALEDWQLLGIIIEGDQRRVILLNQTSGKIQHAQTGDTLPGGEILIEIDDNAIEFLRDNENRRLALFRDIER